MLTWAMCELAALIRDVFGPGCLGEGVTVRRARQLTARMTTWMHRDFQGIFGPLHTPKLHRILAHVLDELRLRGNLRAGDTGVNEAKHKGVKSACTRTNRGRSEHALQLLMAEQVADVLNWAEADNEDVVTDDSIAPNDGEAEAGLPAPHAASAPPAAPDGAKEGPAMPSVAATAASGDDDAPRFVGTVLLFAWVSSRRSVAWRDWPSAWSSETTTS